MVVLGLALALALVVAVALGILNAVVLAALG